MHVTLIELLYFQHWKAGVYIVAIATVENVHVKNSAAGNKEWPEHCLLVELPLPSMPSPFPLKSSLNPHTHVSRQS